MNIGEFINNALSLDKKEFETAMRFQDTEDADKKIDEIEILAWTKEELEACDRL